MARKATAWQKAAKKTQAYKMYKYTVRRTSGGQVASDTQLSRSDVDRLVQQEIDASSPCQYFFERGQYCTYELTDAPEEAADPADPDDPDAPEGQEAYVVTMTSEQAAQLAIAQLKLPAVEPGIGPPPSINRWKMAAVGYPLWLWADGPTTVGPVSQSVANLSVSLEARLTSVTYRMGDGNTVTCQGPGKEWTRAVEPGQPSACGYRYQEPSLPKGNYTVTAISHWDIDWAVGGNTGTVTMDQEGSTELPVGELQSLVR